MNYHPHNKYWEGHERDVLEDEQHKAAKRLVRKLRRRNLLSGETYGPHGYIEVRAFDPRCALHPTMLSKSIEVLKDGSLRRVP